MLPSRSSTDRGEHEKSDITGRAGFVTLSYFETSSEMSPKRDAVPWFADVGVGKSEISADDGNSDTKPNGRKE